MLTHRWMLIEYYGLSLVDSSSLRNHGIGIFSFFLGVVYYGMYAATVGVLWSAEERGEGVSP